MFAGGAHFLSFSSLSHHPSVSVPLTHSFSCSLSLSVPLSKTNKKHTHNTPHSFSLLPFSLFPYFLFIFFIVLVLVSLSWLLCLLSPSLPVSLSLSKSPSPTHNLSFSHYISLLSLAREKRARSVWFVGPFAGLSSQTPNPKIKNINFLEKEIALEGLLLWLWLRLLLFLSLFLWLRCSKFGTKQKPNPTVFTNRPIRFLFSLSPPRFSRSISSSSQFSLSLLIVFVLINPCFGLFCSESESAPFRFAEKVFFFFFFFFFFF